MGRRKKNEIEAELAQKPDVLICPVCGKEFVLAAENSDFMFENGRRPCSWKCFLKRMNENYEKKIQKSSKKP